MAVWLTALFLVVILGVPLLQFVVPGAGREAWSTLATPTPAKGRPLSSVWEINADLLRRIRAFGNQLDDESLVARWTRTPVQRVLLSLGVGNEKAVVGRDGWLFFERDLGSVTGPGFLTEPQLARRERSGDETSALVQPDPVRGIVHFRDQLAARGIELVLVPVPVKPSIHPEMVTGRYADAPGPVRNRSDALFRARLAEEGVAVYDPAPLLWRLRAEGPTYLETDTHWTPAAMEAVAVELAAYLRARFPDLPSATAVGAETTMAVSALGDIGAMLKLPEGQDVFPPETVTVRPVRGTDGEPWSAARDAPVLVLGDSFSNIFSAGIMGWGGAAGLVERLSWHLGLPLDRILQNDAGSHATRGILAEKCAKAAARGRDHLAGKKIVIWEFAERELAQGDWREIELPRPEEGDTPAVAVAAPLAEGEVEGRVAAASNGPDTGGNYKDFVMKLYLTDLVGADGKPYGDGDGVVMLLAMRDREILPLGRLRVGDSVRLRLRPFEEVEDRYGTLTRGELDLDLGGREIMLEEFWGDPVTPVP